MIKSSKNYTIMKKAIMIASLLLSFIGFTFAQTTTPAKSKKTTTTASTAKATTATAPAKATTVAPTKKDGTPDMRYKENKDAAKAQPAPVHTKKDGTADKRYKENKK
jgi:lipopolysaccharide export LptBFGC system permease protein LptF